MIFKYNRNVIQIGTKFYTVRHTDVLVTNMKAICNQKYCVYLNSVKVKAMISQE